TDVRGGRLSDFRMIIRGQQRVTHSDSDRVSGRAREISEKGFYFLKYDPNGSKPGDVWDILPEDTQKRKLHFAPFPEDLCRIPIRATCPKGGIALDPFAARELRTWWRFSSAAALLASPYRPSPCTAPRQGAG